MLRSKTLFLSAGRHLLLERGELGERRIGIDRTIAVARVRARRILSMRRTAFPTPVAIAPAPIASLFAPAFTAGIVAITGLASLVILVAWLAFEAIARPPVPVLPLVLAALGRRGCTGRNGAIRRRRLIGPTFTKITVTAAPPMPVALTPGAISLLASGRFASSRRS
jgi:hypothetical protein